MVLETVKGAAESYYESEMERWEETKELGVSGTFARDFRFGLTGPAPSFDENLDVDYGPEPYNTVNETAHDTFNYTVFGTTDREPGKTPWWLVALVVGAFVMLFSYTLGQLFTFNVDA